MNKEVIFAATQEKAGIGQALAQHHLIDCAVFQLTLQFLYKALTLCKQALIATMSVKFKLEITTVDHRMCGVCACKNVKRHVTGMIQPVRITDSNVTNVPLHFIKFLEIRLNIKVCAK